MPWLQTEESQKMTCYHLTASNMLQGLYNGKQSKPMPIFCSFIVYRSKFPYTFSKIIPVHDHCHD